MPNSTTVVVLLCALVICAVTASEFIPVLTFEEMDKAGLRGMSYNETQPSIDNPNILKGKRVGILASHCFEEVEVTYPYIYLTSRGAKVDVLGPWWVPGKIAACEFVRVTKWATMDLSFRDAVKNNVTYDLLVVSGGVWSSTVVRNDEDAIALIRNQYRSNRLVSAICSGSTVLINAGLAKGRPITGSPAIAIDLSNAGADYMDQPVVVDNNIITGRSPQGDDTRLFCEAIEMALLGQ